MTTKTDPKTEPKTAPTIEEAAPLSEGVPLPLIDFDGDGKPGISWPAAAIVITIIAAGAALIFFGKLPEEVLVLLLGGVGEHVRGRVLKR